MFFENQLHNKIAFRSALENDYDFLYALHVATMKEYVNKTWGWDETFQEDIFRKKFIPSQIQIITLAGNDIGMISLEERNEDLFLHVIEILPRHQRQGFGTTIIQKIIDDAARQRKEVRLQVLKVNPAKQLYDRLGFAVVEETSTHYIMSTTLSS
jgi:ribosomal protein S18 acetylase RimI-like enzyme